MQLVGAQLLRKPRGAASGAQARILIGLSSGWAGALLKLQLLNLDRAAEVCFALTWDATAATESAS